MHSVISVLGALRTSRVCSPSTTPDPIQVTVVSLGIRSPGIFSVELQYQHLSNYTLISKKRKR